MTLTWPDRSPIRTRNNRVRTTLFCPARRWSTHQTPAAPQKPDLISPPRPPERTGEYQVFGGLDSGATRSGRQSPGRRRKPRPPLRTAPTVPGAGTGGPRCPIHSRPLLAIVRDPKRPGKTGAAKAPRQTGPPADGSPGTAVLSSPRAGPGRPRPSTRVTLTSHHPHLACRSTRMTFTSHDAHLA